MTGTIMEVSGAGSLSNAAAPAILLIPAAVGNDKKSKPRAFHEFMVGALESETVTGDHTASTVVDEYVPSLAALPAGVLLQPSLNGPDSERMEELGGEQLSLRLRTERLPTSKATVESPWLSLTVLWQRSDAVPGSRASVRLSAASGPELRRLSPWDIEPLADGPSVYQPPALAMHVQDSLLRNFNIVADLPAMADFLDAVDFVEYPEYLQEVAVPVHFRRIIQVY